MDAGSRAGIRADHNGQVEACDLIGVNATAWAGHRVRSLWGMTIDPVATTSSSYTVPPRHVEPTRSAPTQGDSCDATCPGATIAGSAGLLEDLPGSIPFATHLAKGNRRAQVIEAQADRAANAALPFRSRPQASKPPEGPDLGWPKLGDAPAPEEVRIVRVIERVYRVERLTKPGTFLDMLA